MDQQVIKPAVSTLNEWRQKTLNGVLIIAAVISIPAYISTLLKMLAPPANWLNAAIFTAAETMLITITLIRKIALRIRVIGLLVIGFGVAGLIISISGQTGSVALYLLVTPIIALIFLGKRAGIIAAGISIIFAAGAAYITENGLFLQPVLNSPWVSFVTTIMLTTVAISLLLLFYRFQEQLMVRERQAQKLLAEQNLTLEERVRVSTEELRESNKIQKALYEITDAASSSQDMQEFYKSIHQIIGELMDAGNFFIALYDEKTDLLSYPYYVDEMDDSFPTRPMGDSRNLTSYIIRTGNMVRHGQEEFKRLQALGEYEMEGTPNEDGVGVPLKFNDKVIGAIYVQSYTPGIGYTDKDD